VFAAFLQEAEVLEACAHHLVKRCGLQPGQLGVISPYAAQVSLLSKKLQKGGMRVNGSGNGDSQDGEQLMPYMREQATCVRWAVHEAQQHTILRLLCGWLL
jgi:hypothetical protein